MAIGIPAYFWVGCGWAGETKANPHRIEIKRGVNAYRAVTSRSSPLAPICGTPWGASGDVCGTFRDRHYRHAPERALAGEHAECFIFQQMNFLFTVIRLIIVVCPDSWWEPAHISVFSEKRNQCIQHLCTSFKKVLHGHCPEDSIHFVPYLS